MQESPKIEINAVAFKEGEAWVVQGIEYDIVAHSYDVVELPHAFTRRVRRQKCGRREWIVGLA